MNRTEILKTANEYITKDRQATHGNAENNFSFIARLWSAYTELPITPQDVAMMMALLKMARFKGNPQHTDNAIDLCGYAALAGEIGNKTNEIKGLQNE
jgi:hypothetical protein